MNVFTERDAEGFLKKQGFGVVETDFIKTEPEIKKSLSKFNFPVVLKISSKKIVHKTKVNGIKLGIKDYNQALKAFKELKKIKGFEGVLIQEQIKGKEFLLGLKKTKDFGHVIGFGTGGSKAEKIKDVRFRVCGIKGIEELSKDKNVQKVLDKLCKLAEKYPKINALDINPLILKKGRPIIIDSQIFFE